MPLLPLFALRLLSTLRPALRDYGGQGVFLAATLEVGRSMSCRGKALRRPVDVRCFSLPLTLNFQPSTDLKSLERPSACHASIPAGFNAKEHDQTILHLSGLGFRLSHRIRRMQNEPVRRPASPDHQRFTYVIVHGAWGGGWEFKQVELLARPGHKVYRPTLRGRAKVQLRQPEHRPHHAHQDIVNVILWENLHNVVLVGHSYGGMVITGVVDASPTASNPHLLDARLPKTVKVRGLPARRG